MFACIPGIQILYFYICIVCLVRLQCKSNFTEGRIFHCLLLKEREWWVYIVIIIIQYNTYLGVWHLFLVFRNVILYGWYVRTDSPPGSSSCPVTNIFLPLSPAHFVNRMRCNMEGNGTWNYHDLLHAGEKHSVFSKYFLPAASQSVSVSAQSHC